MNAPLSAIHAEVLGMRQDITETLDRMDDSESLFGFLSNWYQSIPDNLLVESYGEDRIRKHPKYRALSAKAKRVVDWALFPFDQLHNVKTWAGLEEAEEAFIFLDECARRTTEGEDDAHEVAFNAALECKGLCSDLDEEKWLAYRIEESRRLWGDRPSLNGTYQPSYKTSL